MRLILAQKYEYSLSSEKIVEIDKRNINKIPLCELFEKSDTKIIHYYLTRYFKEY